MSQCVEVKIRTWYPAWLVTYKTKRAIEKDRFENSEAGRFRKTCNEFHKSLWRAIWK